MVSILTTATTSADTASVIIIMFLFLPPEISFLVMPSIVLMIPLGMQWPDELDVYLPSCTEQVAGK